MKRNLKRILRILLGLIIIAVLLVAGNIAYLLIHVRLQDKAAEKKLAGTVQLIEVDGMFFRDLNKNGSLDPYEDFRVPVDVRVEDILLQMTLEEKAGMMLHPFLFAVDSLETEPGSKLFDLFSSQMDVIINREIRHVTSSLGTSNAAIHARWQNQIQKIAEQSRLGIPITVSSDPRHSSQIGPAIIMNAFSKWPDQLGFAAIGDSALVVNFGRIAAKEYRAVGIQTALHPMADLATEPRWARIAGTFGEDARLSAKLTAAYIKGFQGDSLTSSSVSCMTKHFPGGGPQKDGWDPHFKYGAEQVYPGNNFNYHLIPFKAAIEAGTAQMMPYYGIPVGQSGENVGFSFNKEMIAGLLQDQLGYKGIICTDWSVITSFKFLGFTVFQAMDHGVEHLKNIEKVEKALNAGIDQFGGEYEPSYIIRLVKEGRITEERIDRSVRKLLKLKFELGLFDNPFVDEESAVRICNNKEFRAAGKDAMIRSMVLLTNRENKGVKTLPLSGNIKIFVMGIDTVVASRYATVVTRFDDADFVLMRLNAPYGKREGFMESIFHQGSLEFSPDSLHSILSVLQTKPTVVGIYLDRPAVIPEIAEQAAALIAHFGTTDEALLDIIFGLVKPTGKLPFEMPSSTAAVEEQLEDVPYDSRDPLFPFGYGLGYDDL